MTERYQHIKRGTIYEVIARGKLQTDNPLTDYAELVAYRCEETGDVWFRPQSEFTPDRFAAIPSDPPDSAGKHCTACGHHLDAEGMCRCGIDSAGELDALVKQASGRARFCRDRGEVKSPEIIERLIVALCHKGVR